jgi:methylenetetrahydrofolate--tRNA-(uracil-5-)-methyltransferase
MVTKTNSITVVGAGLAGTECALQLASRGHNVHLIEMRGTGTTTPAHKTEDVAELVCSNSFGSMTDYSAPGQLKWEAEKWGSFVLKAAKASSVPAGMALGVDRVLFAKLLQTWIADHPNITFERKVISSLRQIPRPAVIATGPLTFDALALDIQKHLSFGEMSSKEFLYFFDAIAPIVDADTLNHEIIWRQDRFDKGTGDYLNCPLEKDQYFEFIDAVLAAKKIEPKEFEKDTPFFDGCMPIEVMAERGRMTPRFGPMSANGLINPRTGKQPFAVVQLRQENREATSYNLVGFQTKMAYAEQKQVFKMIPGLENCEFLKLGSIHRNMYIHTPTRLTQHLSSKADKDLYFAGQITGVEGYFESTCIGLLVAHFLDQKQKGQVVTCPPRDSAMGSLLNAITEYKLEFQPTNINFGLFPQLGMNVRNHEQRVQKRAIQIQKAKDSTLLHFEIANRTGSPLNIQSTI